MVKTPRHSKPTDEGKTIDLDSKDVTKVDAENLDNETKDTSNEAKPDQKSSDEKTASSETKNDVQKDTTKGSSSPVTAGVIGAVIALAGGAGLQWAGILPSAQNSAPQISAEISEKISGLEQSLTALDTRFSEQSTSDSASLMGSLSAVTSRIDALETLVQNDNSGALEAISTINSRLDELSAQIITLEQTPTLTSENGVALPDGLQDEIANLVALSAADRKSVV